MKIIICETTAVDGVEGIKGGLKRTKIDTEDLKHSKLSEIIALIPNEKQKELNDTGKTSFKVITKTLIEIEKQKP